MDHAFEEREVAVEKRFIRKEKDIREDIAWAQINKDVLKSLERPRMLFWVIFIASLALFMVGVACEIYQYQTGIGVANMNNPHVWALYTTNRLLY